MKRLSPDWWPFIILGSGAENYPRSGPEAVGYTVWISRSSCAAANAKDCFMTMQSVLRQASYLQECDFSQTQFCCGMHHTTLSPARISFLCCCFLVKDPHGLKAGGSINFINLPGNHTYAINLMHEVCLRWISCADDGRGSPMAYANRLV